MASVVVLFIMETFGWREHESTKTRKNLSIENGPHKSVCKTLHGVAGIGDMWRGSGLGTSPWAWHEM